MAILTNAHALVVGIAAYRHARALPPTRDAADVAALLVDPFFCGYPPGNVTLLDEDRATGAAIRAALADLAARADEASTVCVFFSGHGGRIADGPRRGEYLLPIDAEVWSEAALAATCVPSDAFKTALGAIPARKGMVVLDCCHAAGIAAPKDVVPAPAGAGPAAPAGLLAPGVVPGLSRGYLDALAAGRGWVVLASAREDESAYVLPGATYGVFTEQLLGGLRGGVPSDDGFVRVFDLFEYLQPRVTAAEPRQHPVFHAKLEENFAVARFRGGEKGTVARDADGFRFDAYVSYVDRPPDADWVWSTLVPRLEAAGLRVAVSGDSETPGVARVVNIERGIRQAKRTVVVLSDAYLTDGVSDFENTVTQTMDVTEGTYRLLPVNIGPIDPARLPTRLAMLTTLDLTHAQPARVEREWARLVEALAGALPRR